MKPREVPDEYIDPYDDPVPFINGRFILSCKCAVKDPEEEAIPATWMSIDRSGLPVQAFGVLCPYHFTQYGASIDEGW